MNIEQLVQNLAEAGVFLAVRDDRLVCKAQPGALTAARRTMISERKAELLAFLARRSGTVDRDEPELKACGTGHALLSQAQRRLWFVERLSEFGVCYTIPVAYRLLGPLDVAALQAALQRVVERHQSLRTMIALQDGEPVAEIRERVEITLDPVSLETCDRNSRETAMRQELQAAANSPIDLAAEVPIRVRLFRLQPHEHAFMLMLHHAAADGWSVENLLRELSRLYEAFTTGGSDPLPPLALQYSDYAAWQREWLQGARLEREREYWRAQLAGAPPEHSLPLDRPRPDKETTAGATWRRRLRQELTDALLETARAHGVTLFMLLQAAFAVLIARWSGETDVVMGTPMANRPRAELAPLIGFFANTLVLRTHLEGNPSFTDVLKRVQKTVLEACDHQQMPFELLVEELNPPRRLGVAPLVQITFSVQDTDEDAALQLPGIDATVLVPDSSNSKFDLSLSINKVGDGFEACWDYCRELFDEKSIAQLGTSFEVLLRNIAAQPAQRIQQLSLMSEVEQATALIQAPLQPDYPRQSSIAKLVSEQAALRPDAIAIVHGQDSLSYALLERKATRFAHALLAEGVQPGDRVGVCMERGVDLVVTLLAVLKLGAAYVPLDVDAPEARLAHMVIDTGMRLCVTSLTFSDLAGLGGAARVCTADIDIASGFPDTSLAEMPGGEHLAYIMYTSGSTGTPKGVAVPHRGVVRLVKGVDYICLDADTVMTQVSNVAFDAATFEIWGALCNGARLVILDKEQLLEPAAFAAVIARYAITTVFVTTALFNRFAQECPESFARLENLLFGGERVSPDAVRRVLEAGKPRRLLHVYGPTENTTFSTWHEIDARYLHNPVIPIGRSVAHSRDFVVNEMLVLQPIGAVGELVLTGDGLAQGYWARPELTAERFVPCPVDWGIPGRLYRSGDLVRRLASGDLEYIGRADTQVKIRGFRIELGEIELHLRAHPAVKDAVVIVRDERGPETRQLVAYWVANEVSGQTLDTQMLQRHLAQFLPPYMLPAAYVRLPTLPLTINGKLDRRALPEPGAGAYSTTAYVPPTTAVQRELVTMWRDLLQLDEIGIDTDFFDLGGHSLLLTKLHNRINAKFDVELALKQLFAAKTVRAQAALIEAAHDQVLPSALPLRPRPEGEPLELSFAQQRLWFIDQMGSAEAVYNIPCVLRLRGSLDVAALQCALARIVDRHTVLRTALIPEGGEARPHVLERFELELPVTDLAALDAKEREAAVSARMDSEAAQPFHLARDLLLRARLLRLAEHEHVLLLTLHHIVADGWSIDVLLHELTELYNAQLAEREAVLPTIAVQYADYAHWQRQWLQGERLTTQLAYWKKQLVKLPLLHDLPLDFPRPEIQRYHGDVHRQYLGADLLGQLQALARQHDTTLFIVLQAAFSVLLARWGGQTDIVMGTPIANRRHEELASLIGFFANTLVLRNDLSGNPRFVDVLAHAKAVSLDAYQHQDVPFEMLVDHLHPKRSLGHSPLFQIMMVLEYDGDLMPAFDGLAMADIAGQSRHAKFDITLNFRQTADGLEAAWGYCRELFEATTIARVADAFRILLETVIREPNRRINELRLCADGMPGRFAASRPRRSVLPNVSGVHGLFERAVAAQPGAAAVRDAAGVLTYAELNGRANRVAHALRAHGVQPDVRVAIHAKRGIPMLVGVLATLKAGGGCVLLDPTHPPACLNAILDDCGARFILDESGAAGALTTGNTPCMALDDAQAYEAYPDTNPEIPELSVQNLAQIAYAPASVAATKGVMVEHRNLLSLVEDGCRYFASAPHVEASWCGDPSVGVSMFELLAPLMLGGTLNPVPAGFVDDPWRFIDWLTQRSITHAYFPPACVRALADVDDARLASLSLQRMFVDCESLTKVDPQRLRRLLPELLLLNVYATCEATAFSPCCIQTSEPGGGNPPTGQPITNTQILLLDQAMQCVPRGMVGEVCIAGDGVARGYLERPALTQEKFRHGPSAGWVFRTGDLGRWLPDGQLELRRRWDRQVALDGVRVEPTEIENLVCSHPQVDKAVVVPRMDGVASAQQLVAYFVPVSDADVTTDVVREHLVRSLPDAMLPAAIMRLKELPVDVRGEIDLAALPMPEAGTILRPSDAAPRTPLERQLTAIWCAVLDQKQIDVNAYFFDLGGNSLCAVRLMAAIEEATGRALPISVLFKAPSIRALAVEMERIETSSQSVRVTLHDGTHPRPLFVFHAAGGDVLCYQPLLRYLPDSVPVHGFARSESASRIVPALKSIEQLAHEYLGHVLELQTEGPLRLAGWSSGGLIALEIAHELEKLGRTVECVCLIDTMLPTGFDVPEQHRQVGLPALQRLSPVEACRMMREYDPELIEVVPQDGVLEIPASAYFNYLVAANQIGLDFYRPAYKLTCQVRYFACARNQAVKNVAERVEELQSLMVVPMRVEEFDATHFSIMEEPAVAGLGRAVADAMVVGPPGLEPGTKRL